MNILVTGGTGFLGGRLAARLKRDGFDVTALGRSASAGAALEARGIRFAQADLGDRDAMRAACRGRDAVVHCGALSAPWGRRAEFHRSNVLGTRHVLEGCEAHGVARLVHVSTPGLYFDFTDRVGIREGDPFAARPANAYCWSKMRAEEEVVEAARRGLDAVILRPRALFGPGDTAILPRLIRANAEGGIPWIDGGRALIDATYIDNAVDALVAALKAPPSLAGQAFNITDGTPIPLSGLLEPLFRKLGMPLRLRPVSYRKAHFAAGLAEWTYAALLPGREPPLTRYGVGLLSRTLTFDASRAREVLGHRPAVGLEEGLERFAHSWRLSHGR